MRKLIALRAPLGLTTPIALSPFLDGLGGESAFQVSLQAGAASQSGISIYPFHLGDVKGLEVPQAFRTAIAEAALNAAITYTPTAGTLELRQELAAYLSSVYGIPLKADNIAVSPSKETLAKLFMMLMGPEAKFSYPVPGYPIYASWASMAASFFNQADMAQPYTLNLNSETPGIDIASLRKTLEAGATVVVINDDHNPTGSSMTPEVAAELQALFAEFPQVFVIFDIAYSQSRFSEKPSAAMGLFQQLFRENRAAFDWTFSKVGAATGARLGCVILPNRAVKTDNTSIKTLMDAFNKLTGNLESCPPSLEQIGLLAALKARDKFDETVKRNNAVLKERRDVLMGHLGNIEGVKAATPDAGFYVFADVTQLIADLGFGKDVEAFRKAALDATGVSFCTGNHFGETDKYYPDQRFVRFAFSGITKEDIDTAMVKFKQWIEDRKFAQVHFQDKKVAVFGAGPVGQLAAHRLSLAGVQTTLVTRNAYEAVQDHGVQVTLPVPMTSKPEVVRTAGELTGPLDVIFIANKVTDDIRDQIRHLVGPQTQIVCLQNGITAGDAYQQAFPDNIVAQVSISVQIRRDGDAFTIPKELGWKMGPKRPDQQASDLKDLAQALRGVGFKNTEAVDPKPMQTAAWEKLIRNLANFAVLQLALVGKGQTYGDLLADDAAPVRAQVQVALDELLGIARSRGVELPKSSSDYMRDILAYVKTGHICTTLNAYAQGLEIEDLLADVIGLAGKESTSALAELQAPVLQHNKEPKQHTLKEGLQDAKTLEALYQKALLEVR
ncbi:MAG: aminotransferase class I/II-fold pyridoxal phosphate-dependent enzyme [Candidatus Margulisiibacteriota bacterium]